jgi:hypothetical protein
MHPVQLARGTMAVVWTVGAAMLYEEWLGFQVAACFWPVLLNATPRNRYPRVLQMLGPKSHILPRL